MGPALETFLTLIGIALLLLGAAALFLRPVWPRIVRYFRAWYERDMRMEEEMKRQEQCRRQAEAEVTNTLMEYLDPPEPKPAMQKAGVGKGEKEA